MSNFKGFNFPGKKNHSAGNPFKSCALFRCSNLSNQKLSGIKAKFSKASGDFDTVDVSHLGSRSLRLLRGRQGHLSFDFDFFLRETKKTFHSHFHFTPFRL